MFIKSLNQQSIDKITNSFCIHFDLEGKDNHSILLDHSIITEQAIKTVIFELNQKVFEGKLEIEIYILSAEEGGLVKRFCQILLGTIALGRAFVESTTGSRIIKGLTGKERGDYVEDETIVIKEMAIGFLEKKNTDLVNSGIDYDTFYRAYDSKNKFYQETLKNPQVKGLGFDREHSFPVPRNEFKFRITDLKEHTSDIEPVDKFHNLIVISHINTVEDKKLTRQVKDKKVKKRFEVYMGDHSFYDFFLSAPFYIINMTVKVRYYLKRNDEGEILIDKKEIITVYEYNDKIYFDIPENIIIEPAPRTIKEEEIVLEVIEKKPGSEGTLFEGLM